MVNCDEGHPGFLVVNGNYTSKPIHYGTSSRKSFGQLGMISVRDDSL